MMSSFYLVNSIYQPLNLNGRFFRMKNSKRHSIIPLYWNDSDQWMNTFPALERHQYFIIIFTTVKCFYITNKRIQLRIIQHTLGIAIIYLPTTYALTIYLTIKLYSRKHFSSKILFGLILD